jgi:hypothetical protein
MANTGFLSVSETSFDGIKNNLKTFLKAKTEFQDYNFEGSNLSAMLDVLSYNTYMNAYYLNMVASEMFLDSSQIRESVVSHSKELSYLPRSRTSARALVTFTINTNNTVPISVIIPEDYVVRTVVDNIALDFTVPDDIVITAGFGGIYSVQTYVYEGKVVQEFFTVDGSTSFILNSDNVDTNSIKVYITNSSSDPTTKQWAYSDTIYGLTPASEVFFIQGNDDNNYEVVFGDGVLGKALTNGNIVRIKYRSTNGDIGNRAYDFTTTSQVDGFSVSVSTNVIASDGSERETIDSMKFYAPRYYSTQNRGVTRDDFETLIRQRFPQIKTVGVYGGEDANPPMYGKVIITPVPYGTLPILSGQLKQAIINYLSTKTITTEAIIRDPEYLFIEILSNVLFDSTLTSKNASQIKSEIVTNIQNFDALNLSEFGSDFRKSKLIATIDNTDQSIISNDTQVRVIYKIAPQRTVNQRIEFSYGNALYRPLQIPYQQNEQEVFKSNSFVYLKNNAYYNAYISDDGIGGIRLYYLNQINSPVILEPNIGTINYATGDIAFDINPWTYSTTIDLFAKLNSSDITVNENKFLRIDYTKINVNVGT